MLSLDLQGDSFRRCLVSVCRWQGLFTVVLLAIGLSGCGTPFKPEERPRLEHTDPLETFPPKPRRARPKPPPLPPSWPAAFDRKVSVQIDETTPLKEALKQLIQQAGVNAALASGIDQHATLACQACSLKSVLEQIARLAKLRFSWHGDSLYIEPDTPYLAHYNAHFLSLVRASESHFSVNTEVFSARNDSRTAALDGGNKNIITGQTSSDFWQELESNLHAILKDGAAASASSLTLHRQAGLLSVFATQRQHERIAHYLKKLQHLSTAQVLIEAKIVEVSLKREYQSGIDWNVHGFSTQSVTTAASTLGAPASLPKLFNIALKGKNFSSTLKFLETFGKTRTLSSPRLTVLNNQPAIFKVAENRVYFRLRYERLERSRDLGGDIVSATSDIHTMPLGLIMSVQPSINRDDDTITLALRPTITSSKDQADDPAVAITSQSTVTSSVPIVEVRELDSVLHVTSGQPVVLGGLMQERSRERTSGLPGMTATPVVRTLFGSSDARDHEIVELVIFLRAHILDDANDAEDAATIAPTLASSQE